MRADSIVQPSLHKLRLKANLVMTSTSLHLPTMPLVVLDEVEQVFIFGRTHMSKVSGFPVASDESLPAFIRNPALKTAGL